MFCAFALYQPEDGAGPFIEEQLSGGVPGGGGKFPFKCVIDSVKLMFVVHTTKADLYDRLWCVYELDEALERKGKVTVEAILSEEYKKQIIRRYCSVRRAGGNHEDGLKAVGAVVMTARAACSQKDMKMLMKQIFKKKGGFNRLDAVIKEFRATFLKECVKVYECLLKLEEDERMH